MIYDTSVVVKCLKYLQGRGGDEKACEVIFSDDNCIIPPTATEELKEKPRTDVLEKIEEHCTLMTYDDHPFNEDNVRMHVEMFADEIRREWIGAKPRGHSEIARLKREFNREVRGRPRCHGSGNIRHKVNDYKIIKEANVLAEYGIADTLVSADYAHTDPVCQLIYEKIMEEYLPEKFGDEFREDFVVNVKFYRDI